MTTADELERCRRQLRELDEQEMLLASYQRKSQQLAEETYYNIQSAIRMIAKISNHYNKRDKRLAD